MHINSNPLDWHAYLRGVIGNDVIIRNIQLFLTSIMTKIYFIFSFNYFE